MSKSEEWESYLGITKRSLEEESPLWRNRWKFFGTLSIHKTVALLVVNERIKHFRCGVVAE